MCRAALPAALLPPRRSLSRRHASTHALVDDDAMFVEVGRTAGHHHGHSALHHSKVCRPFPFASCALQVLHPLLPRDERTEGGAGRPTLWPNFFYAILNDSKLKKVGSKFKYDME